MITVSFRFVYKPSKYLHMLEIIFDHLLQIMIFDVKDVSAGHSLELLVSLYSHQAPIRVGVLPVANEEDEAGALLAQIFYKLVEETDGPEALLKLAEV